MVRSLTLAVLSSLALLLMPTTYMAVTTLQEFEPLLTTKEQIVAHSNRGLVLRDRNNQPFFTFYQGKTPHYIALDQIPMAVQQAAIAMEDHTFYQHRGFSPRAIVRSFISNLKQHRFAAGGSTITQQLVKNSILTPHKSLSRKYKEIVLAAAVERQFTKADILEMYLNTVYFGEGAYGIENAARTYFAKSAPELTLPEASFLIAILPAPTSLSPFNGGEVKARARQKLVLQRMRQHGFIDDPTQAATYGTPLHYAPTSAARNIIAPHFALMVRDELLTKYSEKELALSGFQVTTTLDLAWQATAEASLTSHVAGLRRQRVSNGAVVVLDPTSGAVRALVGSTDWHDPYFGKVNMATTPRQTGSAFKPIVYATAFENRTITPATILKDQPTTFGRTYRPVNYDRRYRGNVLARRALALSLNIPAVEVLSRVGVSRLVTQATALGITTLTEKQEDNLALALGAAEISLLDMVGAYGTLAQAGMHHPTHIIDHITDKFNRTILTTTAPAQRAISAESAFLVSSILSDAESRREVFGSALNLSRPAAVKTGTTNEYRGAWTMGYTPQLVVGVWIGNNDNSPMHQVAGAMGAAPLWRNLTEIFLADQPQLTFNQPSTVVAVAICRHDGFAVPVKSFGGYTEYFVAGTQPTRHCGPRPVATPSPSPGPVIAQEAPEPRVPKERPNKESRDRES